MLDRGVVSGRLAPYWITVASSLFIMACFYGGYTDEGYVAFAEGLYTPVRTLRFASSLSALKIDSLAVPTVPSRRSC
jgi:hypothetical protein